MSSEFWNMQPDFFALEPFELVERQWKDDERNRKRSLATFKDEIRLVDRGLTIYISAIQAVLKEGANWENDDCIRASIAMLIHAFNSFLARRHLLIHGYWAESRLFERSIYEALCQSFVFSNDESFSRKFYEGTEIRPRDIRERVSSLLATEDNDKKGVRKEFGEAYNLFSASPNEGFMS